jgi:dihydrofolate reductase
MKNTNYIYGGNAMLSIVAAIAENNIIGRDNSLLWSLPEDLERFKKITLSGSKTMIMGRKTFESINRILPGRRHIILTRNKAFKVDDENAVIVHSLEDLKPFIESEKEYFIIGGGEIYSLLLPYAKKMYLTKVDGEFYGDTFFPEFNKNEWRVLSCEDNKVSELCKYDTTFMLMEKVY